MHHWTAYTCRTFSIAWEFWQCQAPLLAMRYRYCFDAMLALAALHASRQVPRRWLPLEGRLESIPNGFTNADNHPHEHEEWKLRPDVIAAYKKAMTAASAKAAFGDSNQAARQSLKMLLVAHAYFDRAIDEHRRALANLTAENIEATYVTSVMVAFNALFTLGGLEQPRALPPPEPGMWFRLSSGTALICQRWKELVGPGWIKSSGVFYGKPDMSDEQALFDPEHGKPLWNLITTLDDYVAVSHEDRVVYQKAVSYTGLIFKAMYDGTDEPLVTSRRIIAMPARLPIRFAQMVEEKQPHAMAILAHVFATMRLIEHEVDWYVGIAQAQIPIIHQSLPREWKGLVDWPLAVAAGQIGPEDVASIFAP
jgi:hypothetical protein